MDQALLKRLFPNASSSTIRANDPAGAALPHPEQCQRAPVVGGSDAGKAQGTGCPLVVFTLYRLKLLDVDAKYGSVKDLLDGLADAGLIPGDKEGQIRLQVDQYVVAERGAEKTVIEIYS